MPLVRLDTEEEPAPNLAPMIDVILVLTIFFMCATKFSADERRFDLDLPQAGGAADQAAPGPEVRRRAAGGAALSAEDLRHLIERAKQAGGSEASYYGTLDSSALDERY